MLTAVIVDDEPIARNNLRNLLTTYCPEVRVLDDFGKPMKAIKFLEDHPVDCVFLDIEMPEINGFEFIQQIDHSNIKIIFVTAYASYSIKAFKANAIDYILKPIKISELEGAVEKLKEHKQLMKYSERKEVYLQSVKNLIRILDKKSSLRITVPSTHGFKLIDCREIMWLEADGAYSKIVMAGRKPEFVTKNLGHFEDILDENRFVRIHYSSLINLDYLQEFTTANGGSVIMKDGSIISVAKRRIKEFKQKVHAYYS